MISCCRTHSAAVIRKHDRTSEASTEGQLDRIADRTESVATEHLLTKEEQALLDNTRTPPMAKEKIQKKETLYDRVIRGLQD